MALPPVINLRRTDAINGCKRARHVLLIAWLWSYRHDHPRDFHSILLPVLAPSSWPPFYGHAPDGLDHLVEVLSRFPDSGIHESLVSRLSHLHLIMRGPPTPSVERWIQLGSSTRAISAIAPPGLSTRGPLAARLPRVWSQGSLVLRRIIETRS